MLARFFAATERLANGRAIALLLALFVFFSVVVFPFAKAKRAEVAGDVGALDALFAYTPVAAYELLDAYGDEGRRIYALTVVTADLVYPPIVALLFSALMGYAFSRAFAGHALLLRLTRLPFVYLLADYSENASIVAMLANYPNRLPTIAQMAANFTTIKWLLVGVCAVLTLVGFVALSLQRVNRGAP